MSSITQRLIVNGKPVINILDYVKIYKIVNGEKVPHAKQLIASWTKLRKEETELGRELTASGKLVSLLIQFGCPFKKIADTLTADSYCGAVINYNNKNLEDILNENQPDKIPKLNIDPYKIKT